MASIVDAADLDHIVYLVGNKFIYKAMKREEQAEITDEIIVSACLLDGRRYKVGQAYEKIAQRKGTEFREKVKKLPSESFASSRMAAEYKAEPSDIEKALEYNKKNIYARKNKKR